MEHVDLAIIGGGMAGLTAGIYAAWHRLDAVLLERMGTGGQIINADAVLNFPGFPGGTKGYDLAPLVAQQAMEMGLRVEYADAQGIALDGRHFRIETDGDPWRARAVILATGSTLAKLGCPGEEEYTGRGVSYCAVCDAEFFRDQPVVVVGGGDSAMDEALFLAEVASGVTILVRDARLTAAATLVEQAQAHPKITIQFNRTVTAIAGGDALERVHVQAADGSVSTLACEGVFIYTGLQPNTDFLGDLLTRDAGGHIAVDAWMRTAVPGLFGAGDIRQHSARQLVTCAGDGATAAIAAARYLKTGAWGD